MSNYSSILTLIDLATQQSEKAGLRLSQANFAYQEEIKKLELLTDYRNQYGEQLDNKMAQGLNMSAYNNYQTFLSNLNKAINQQQKTVNSNKNIVDHYRKEWQKAEQKRLSFQTLNDRNRLINRINENKTEQKLNDEMSSRLQQVRI